MKRLVLLGLGLLAAAAPASAQTLWKSDFETASVWPGLKAQSVPRTVLAAAARGAVGTIDKENTAQASGGVKLSVRPPAKPKGMWSAAVVSGLLPIKNTETNLGKLTLSFQLSAASTRPVFVRVESFDAKKKRTGGVTGFIYPAAPNFYQRYVLDLSSLKPTGAGTFSPTAPYVQFSFGITESGAESRAEPESLLVDDVNYAAPAYYVSPQGSDAGDGRTEKTAFATPQKALDAAQPGDIVLLMEGTYEAGQANVASFRRGGLPDAWITLKNYPGQKPLLTSTGWNIVSIAAGSKEKRSDIPSLCYLEVRGLHIRGEGDVAKKKYPDAMNKPDSRTNSNGISVDGRYMKNIPHHLRFADNLVEYCPGGGIGAGESDWVTVENNICRNNCWTTIYATSGISFLGASNFDASDNIYRMLVRNNVCYRNETYEIWQEIKKPSDGNGIIIDVNQKTNTRPDGSFRGRTLVQSNLSFNNGGSGIHTVRANRVDIINNTAYLNSASKALEYGEIFTYGSDDVRIINNIMVAPVADVASGEKPEPINKLGGKNTNVVFSHNLYFGGNIAPTLGEGDVIADPQFMNPSVDAASADFHLKPGSPAIGQGVQMPFGPFLDLEGKPRQNPPTLGAYKKQGK